MKDKLTPEQHKIMAILNEWGLCYLWKDEDKIQMIEQILTAHTEPEGELCPVCREPMEKVVDEWVCVNIICEGELGKGHKQQEDK